MAAEARVLANRYELGSEIGRGGMARVYIAHDRLLERTVAVKVLSALDAHDEVAIERFRREAQAAARLSHPGIVGVYDWGEDDDTAFIVMEYVDGQTLGEVIHEYGRLSAMETARVGAEIADALAFAHHNGVVHRDVKPGNVLITPQGQVKVTDFGIARADSSDALTKTGAVMGTATYFSPEQAQGHDLDGRSDVYSLGVVLYEMLTGVVPFTADSPVSVAYKHVREEPRPPSELVPDLPGAMERIVLNAMAKDVGHRYQSADALRADLMRFERGRPLAGGLIAASPTAGIVVDAPTTATPRLAPVAPAATPGPPRRRRWGAVVAIGTALALLLAFIVVLLVNSDIGDSEPEVVTVGVPGVVGLPVDEADATLQALGFAADHEELEAAGQPANVVIGQSPERGRKAKEGSTIVLTVSSPNVLLPDVVGQPRDQATATLSAKGITATFVEEDSDQPPGTVLLMFPAAGTPVPKADARVGLQVAREPPIPVPDVVGQEAVPAAALLTQAGFQVTSRNDPSDNVPVGRVIGTDPPPGTPVPRGGNVTVLVSSGPDLIEIPNVVGQPEAPAISALTGAGFNVTITYQNAGVPNRGKVLSQSPTGGTAPRLATVNITVGN